MEHVHGVDVSWMIHGSPRDKSARTSSKSRLALDVSGAQPVPTSQTTPSRTPDSPLASTPPSNIPLSTSPKPAASARPTLSRNGSSEKTTNGAGGTPPQRRNSWFSNISSKFSSAGQSPPQANNTPPKQAEISVPRANPAKNAVLAHAAKYEGDGPYTPAPPKSTQAGLLQVFRRLSAGTGGMSSPNVKGHHGLVERRVLNVDRHRERCSVAELNPAKLRRVSFCVDVEIAPMPRYPEPDGLITKVCTASKRKPSEKGEGDALKSARSTCGEARETTQSPTPEPAEVPASRVSSEKDRPQSADGVCRDGVDSSTKSSDPSKKKEKKKKSEEERKARKEKKRKLAEVNGTVPMEIHLDSDSSGSQQPASDNNGTVRAQSMPTANPVRIYRRCCQLRETPILKKLTEQLSNPENVSTEDGVVEKLDLSSYWMQLPDLVTLGDYLAVVPIRELLLENCGLNDEGLRVVLAGLLASKKPQRRLRRAPGGGEPDGLVVQGGVVKRLVLRNNKIGPEGWKHLSQFVYLCRSLQHLDVSILPFPASPHPPPSLSGSAPPSPAVRTPTDACQLFSKCLATRLAGPKLELLNLAETLPDSAQLGVLIDGIIKCGIKRLGLARNNIDAEGVSHVSRYMASGQCQGLDLVGNDLRDGLDAIAESLPKAPGLVALNLAECNLKPGSLCNMMSKLVKIEEFRFIDLSHNQDLFGTNPSCISLLRRYLPKMACLKKIYLRDVSMSSEQAIALAEILPEVSGLAHINLLENPELANLADAKTEETQEEACALYASLLAATRVSTSIMAVDIDVPTEQSSEIVKALAKQVVAYCLRNMENLPLGNVSSTKKHDPEYPDVLQHLVGHDATRQDGADDDEPAPDDDYVIGGTGVVKALACCLKNRGDESRRPSGEFVRDAISAVGAGSGEISPLASPSIPPLDPPRRRLHAGKAKDMSKHLLGSARKIRQRLQPAMDKAKAVANNSAQDAHAYQRLLFLDRTLDGIIKRFEDEFPDTRESGADPVPETSRTSTPPSLPLAASFGSDADAATTLSDAEDEAAEDMIRRPVLSRSNSAISITSKGLTNEEGRVLRAGHKFRSGWITQQHYDILLGAIEQIEADATHVRFLHEILGELNDEWLNNKIKEEGLMIVFRDNRDYINNKLREQDPEHWELFVESQKMARANVNNVEVNGNGNGNGKDDCRTLGKDAAATAVTDCSDRSPNALPDADDEVAVSD